MKNFILKSASLLIAGALILASCKKENVSSTDDNLQPLSGAATLTSPASLMAHSQKSDCTRGYGECGVAITNEPYDNQENMLPVTLQLTGQDKMAISNKIFKLSEDGNYLKFDADYLVPEYVTADLQKSSITIKAGTYSTVFTPSYPNGRTIVDVEITD